MTSGRMGDPQAQHVAALKTLRETNVRGMLTDTSSFDDVGEFMEYHPPTKGLEFRNPRYLAINLTNLYTEGSGPSEGCQCGKCKGYKYDEKKSDKKYCKDEKCRCGRCHKVGNSDKGTVEVRLNSGTMDPLDVWGAYEFMGKLMLWLSTPGIDHNAVILSLWADPESTLLDLINEVGASQATVDYYTDRLSSNWAIRRHHRLTSNIDPNGPFKAFKLAIEKNRLKDSRREAVDAKISQKLLSGHYGQVSDAVFKTLPAAIQNYRDSHILNMDACDYDKWFDKAVADHKASTTKY